MDEDFFQRALDGKLSPDEALELRRQAMASPELAARLAFERALRDAVRRDIIEPLPPDNRRALAATRVWSVSNLAPHPARWIVAAAALIAAGIGIAAGAGLAFRARPSVAPGSPKVLSHLPTSELARMLTTESALATLSAPHGLDRAIEGITAVNARDEAAVFLGFRPRWPDELTGLRLRLSGPVDWPGQLRCFRVAFAYTPESDDERAPADDVTLFIRAGLPSEGLEAGELYVVLGGDRLTWLWCEPDGMYFISARSRRAARAVALAMGLPGEPARALALPSEFSGPT